MISNNCLIIFLLSAGGLMALSPIAFSQSPDPEHIILTWKGDPSTTQSVTWRTDVPDIRARAQIAPASPAPYEDSLNETVTASTQRIENEEGKAYYYSSVTFKGLTPGTLYRYRVGAENGPWSAWNHFRTAGKTSGFSFIYLGDIQTDIRSWGSRTIRAAYAACPRAAFMLFAGDCVDNGHSDPQWIEWFDALGFIPSVMPIVPVTGNHEYYMFRNTGTERTQSVFWQPQFELPENGPEGLEESVYVQDYKNLRLIVLNSVVALRSPGELKKQTQWLESVLKENDKEWTVVSFHHALFSARDGRHGDYPELRAAWQPLLEKYGVDLVLQGHDHMYGRANRQVRDISVPKGEAGPVYIVTIAGPKMYGMRPEKRWADRAAVNTQLYQIITISGDTLQFKAYTATDELYDAFDLQKQPGKYNRFIERISSSEMAENRFPDGNYTRPER